MGLCAALATATAAGAAAIETPPTVVAKTMVWVMPVALVAVPAAVVTLTTVVVGTLALVVTALLPLLPVAAGVTAAPGGPGGCSDIVN